MNNKGQTLILFLFLFPVVFLIFMAFYQIGTIQLEKKKMEEVAEEAVFYGISNWNEENVEEVMLEMMGKGFPKLGEEEVEIEVEPGVVKMTIQREYRILFLVKQDVKIVYEGSNIDGKVQIIKG